MQSEGKFTKPSPWCMNPELYSAYDAMNAEVEVYDFLYSLVKIVKPHYCIETGTYNGRGAHTIGSALKANGRGNLDTLEIANVKHILDLTGLPVTCHRVSSLDFVPRAQVDFLFLDSDQIIRNTEFKRFLPYLSLKCIVVMHDTAPHQSTDCILRKFEGWNFIDFYCPRGLTVAQRKST